MEKPYRLRFVTLSYVYDPSGGPLLAYDSCYRSLPHLQFMHILMAGSTVLYTIDNILTYI